MKLSTILLIGFSLTASYAFGQSPGGGYKSGNAGYTPYGYAPAITIGVPTGITVSSTGSTALHWDGLDYDVFLDSGENQVSRANTWIDYEFGFYGSAPTGFTFSNHDGTDYGKDELDGWEAKWRLITNNATSGYYILRYQITDGYIGGVAAYDPGVITKYTNVTINP